MNNLQRHKYNVFPKMEESEFSKLRNSIKKGYDKSEPIILFEGYIIDGANRYDACMLENITPIFIEFKGTKEEAIQLVKNKNTRRDMAKDQKTACYLMLEDHIKELVEQAETERRKKISESMKGNENANQKQIGEIFPRSESIRQDEKPKDTYIRTNQKIAEDAGTNEKYVKDLKKLKEENEEKFNKIAKGETTLSEVKKEEKQKQLEQKKEEILNITKREIDIKPKIKIMNAVDFLNTFDDNSIDCLFTDPPYSTDVDDIELFANSWLPLALKKLKPESRSYICIGAYPKELNSYLSILLNQNKFIVDNPLIWTYRNTLGITPKNKYNLNYQIILHLYSESSKELDTGITNEMFSVQDINAPDGRLGNRYHTWQKPIELSDRLIRHSTKEGDLVVDCFSCTGTFLLSASKLKRKALGCEINLENAKIAESRGCEIENL